MVLIRHKIFLSTVPYDFLLTVIKSKSKKNFSFFYYSAPLFYRVRVIPNSEISGTYRVPDGYPVPVHPYLKSDLRISPFVPQSYNSPTFTLWQRFYLDCNCLSFTFQVPK